MAGSRIAAAGLQAVLFVLLARATTTRMFALVAGAQGIAVVGQAIGDLGISTTILREQAREAGSPLVRACLFWNSRVTLVMVAITSVTIAAIGLAGPRAVLDLLPLAVWMGAEKNADSWMSVFLADGQAGVNAVNLVVRRALAVAAEVALLRADVAPVLACSLALAIAACFSNIRARYLVVRSGLRAERTQSFLDVFEASKFYAVNSVAVQLRNADVALTSAFGGAAAAAAFSLPSRVISPLRLLPTSCATVLLPVTTRRGRGGVRSHLAWMVVVSAGMGAMLAGLAAVAPWLLRRAVGPSFLPAVEPLRVLCVGLVLACLCSFLTTALQALGRSRVVSHTAAVTGVAALVCIAIGATVDGAAGAAWGLSWSYLGQAVWLGAALRRVMREPSTTTVPAPRRADRVEASPGLLPG